MENAIGRCEVININAGVLANIIIILLIVLIFTDWFSVVDRLGRQKTIYFLFLFLVSSQFSISIPNDWQINIGGFILPLLIYFVLLWAFRKDRLYILTATLLLGSSYFLFKELIRLDPILLFWDEIYELSFFMVFILMIIAAKLQHKIMLLIGGFLLGEFLFNFNHRDVFEEIVLGNGNLRDYLWFSFVQLISYHYIVIQIANWFRKKNYITFIKIR